MVPTVRTGPALGLIAQVALLGGLAATVGLGVAGWLTGIMYGTVTCVALTLGLHRSGMGRLGAANRVTLTRAVLIGGVAALTIDSFARHAPVRVLLPLLVVALMLDAVDGYVARRTGTTSVLGARFDMEVDAFLLLVLSVYVMRPLGGWAVGGWALAIGAMRYAFVLATWLLPWMRGSLPPRYWRKVVAAIQGVVLVAATADVLPRPLITAALAGSLALLVESFGRDVWWLWRHRAIRPAYRDAPAQTGQETPALPRQSSGAGQEDKSPRRTPSTVGPDVVAAPGEPVRYRSNSGRQRPPLQRSGHPVLLGRRRGDAGEPG